MKLKYQIAILENNLNIIERQFNYKFKNKNLLKQAFFHDNNLRTNVKKKFVCCK